MYGKEEDSQHESPPFSFYFVSLPHDEKDSFYYIDYIMWRHNC